MTHYAPHSLITLHLSLIFKRSQDIEAVSLRLFGEVSNHFSHFFFKYESVSNFVFFFSQGYVIHEKR